MEEAAQKINAFSLIKQCRSRVSKKLIVSMNYNHKYNFRSG